MCMVSAVGDNWRDDFKKRYPNWHNTNPVPPLVPNWPNTNVPTNTPTRDEFENLKKEVEELKKVLLAAKQFDEATNQKDCEMEEKIALIKRVAEAVGVDMNDVFGK